MVRGGLARAYLSKYEFDRAHEQMDLSQWYAVEGLVGSGPLATAFIQSAYDEATAAFLDASKAQSESVCLQLWYNVAVWLLSWRLSKTSINGLLNRGSMFLFSRAQAQALLGLPDEWSPAGKAMLDLGAGNGAITAVLADFYPKVYATEASQPMIWRLEERGYEILDLATWPETRVPLNLIAALNLIDRHPTPLLLLKQLRQLSLANDGAPILLAAVFPWYQYSEFSDSHVPEDSIRLERGTFAQQVAEFADSVLAKAGLAVVRWTRLPYLCEGDAWRSYYLLYDAVFLLRPM